MKTIVRTSNNTATGYEMVIINEQGVETVIAIDKTYPNEPYTLVLPENPSNRKYFNSKKVDAANGEIELTYKESKKFGPRTNSGPRKKDSDYLSEEDKALLESLLAKAKANKKEATKKQPMTELEKAQRRLAKAKELVAQLKAQAKAEAESENK